MNWEDVWKIVIGVIAGFGGASGIIILTIKFIADFIANSLSKKYQLKLDEELEKYKTKLDQKTYITKKKFDSEYEIYKNLTRNFFQMVKAESVMIPAGLCHVPADENERKKFEETNYKNCVNSTVVAQDSLYENAAFIKNEFYLKFQDILKNVNLQISEFQKRWNLSYMGSYKEKSQISTEAYSRSKNISDDFLKLTEELRTYFASLEIID